MKSNTHCSGCRNNFYNGHNDLGVSECWSLPDAKLVTKYCIPSNVPMNIKSAYVKVKVPNCYHKTGYAYLERIPE